MIVKNLLRRKGRTILTVLGISIGVAAIVGLGSMADSLQAGYQSVLTGSKADLILSQPNTFDTSYSSVDEKIGQHLAAMPEVAAVSGMLQGIVQSENVPYFFVFGYPEDSFVLKRFNIIRGIGLADAATQRVRGKPLILGSAAAESLKKEVGDALRLTGTVFRVVGIYQTGDAFEDSGAVFRLSDAQELLGKPRQVSIFYIQLKDADLQQRLKKRLERIYPDLELSTSSEYADKQLMSSSGKVYVWVIAGIAVLLGGVGMMNAQLMSVFERTREIGVLRAVGWKRRRILGLILGETVLVCLVGGTLGIVLGWVLLALVSQQTVLFGSTASNIRPGLILQAYVVVLMMGLLGGLYPAWRASSFAPIEAIRYEGGSAGANARRLPFGGMAVQSLWQRLTRTLLTLSVISLTVGNILAMDALMEGMAKEFTGLATGSDVEIMVRQADVSDTSLSALDSSVGAKIAAIPNVAHVSGMLLTAVMLPETGGFFIIQGYAPNEYAIRRFKITNGETLKNNRQMIIGRLIAQALKKQVGDSIELSGVRFRIVGIFETGIGWEEMGGVMTLRDAQTFMGRPRKVTMYAVKVAESARPEEVVEQINRKIPEAYAALSGDFVEQMPDMQNTRAMMLGISLLAIVVGGMAVMNTMLMAVLERTREIGVLRAVGWRRLAILGIIVRESLIMALIGGALGVVFAFLLALILKLIPDVREMVSFLWTLKVFFRALLVTLILGTIGGLYPAYRATRLHPVEALRYE
ncbi:MAG: ABC transporter permease [Anaerolineae bacterium]|nr:ABC transporter permease [Anaerolineae bacterium]